MAQIFVPRNCISYRPETVMQALVSLSNHICLNDMGTGVGSSCLLFAAARDQQKRETAINDQRINVLFASLGVIFSFSRTPRRLVVLLKKLVLLSSWLVCKRHFKTYLSGCHCVTFWAEHFNISNSITSKYCSKSGTALEFIADLLYIGFRTIMDRGTSVTIGTSVTMTTT